MFYDKEKVAAAAKNRRADFIITAIIFGVIIGLAVVAAVLMRKNPISLIVAAIALVWIIVRLVDLCNKKPPRAIFATALEGEIIKKEIKTKTGRKRTVTTTQLTVKRTDGKEVKIKALSSEVFGIYEVGDKVLRVGGTLYPIITSRTPKCNICVLCGAVYTPDKKECKNCKI